MKSIVKLNWEHGVSIEDVPLPIPNKNEVRVKVIGSAICGSDLHIYESAPGYEWLSLPMTPGHEVSGYVESTGSAADKDLIGKRVVIDPYIPCGHCDQCDSGHSNLCDGGKMILDKIPSEALQIGFRRPGGMAEYVIAPTKNLMILPENIDDDVACMLESFAVSVHATEHVAEYVTLSGSESALVIGPGPIGLGVVAALRAQNVRNIIVAGLTPDKNRLEIAKQLGAKRIFDASRETYKDVITEKTNGHGVDFVYDCSGHPAGLNEAIQVVRRGGKIVLVGIYGKPAALPANALVRGELSIIGTYGTTPSAFQKAVQFVAEGKANLKPMITHVLNLQNADEAFRYALSKEGCKIVLKP